MDRLRCQNLKKQENFYEKRFVNQKYPILLKYQKEVNIESYARRLDLMLSELKEEDQYRELDTMLVLKDILY